MKFNTKAVIFFLFICNGFKADAQSFSFSGLLQDGHTKEPIAYASVYFKNSGKGKTSDSTGNFSFHFNSFNGDTLVISYVGYQDTYIPVSIKDDGQMQTILLQRAAATGGVFVRSRINKGLFLWKKIMSKKKQYNRYNLSNFSYEAYNKLEVDIKNFNPAKAKKNFLLKPFSFIFDNIDSTSEKAPFLPAYLLESVSDYAYQKNSKKYYERIKASNTKGFKNESITKLTGVMDQNVNIYGNYVNIIDKDFISPFNDNADIYYNFSVPDTQIVNDHKLFHFVFTPKRPGQNTFEGDAWVFGMTFQIQKISLFLGKEANINFIDRVSIFQEFVPINDSIYFLNRDKFYADFRVLGKQSLTLIGRKSTSYKNIIVNNDSIADLFKTQTKVEVTKVDSASFSQTDSAWARLRHDSLSKNEKAIYTTIDKLLQMPKFQRLQRTLRFIGTGYKDIGNVTIGPVFNWISGNVWEGTRFRFDLGTNTGFNKNLYLHGYLAYGTLDKKLKGQAEAFWILKRDPKRFRLHASYSSDIDNGISQVGEVSQDNIFSLAIRKPNTTRKFIDIKDLRLEAFNEIGRGFSTELFLVHRQYDPLKNLPVATDFPVSSGRSLNNFEVALKIRFASQERFLEGNYFRYSLGARSPIVEVMLTKGISGIFNSAYNYTKISASVKDVFKISPYGTLTYKIYGGKINGTLPFPFLENHPGNDIYYYNPGAFNLMTRFEYLSDKYAGLNIEHNIGSGIFRFTALTRKLKWRQFWNAKMLLGSLSDENIALNTDVTKEMFKTLNGRSYIEVGTGIDNIFKVFRIDLVWRLAPTVPYAPKASKFGIFGSFQFQF